MVPAKPWQVDAIIRLVLSVVICAFAGSVVVAVLHYATAAAKVSSRLFFPLAAVALLCLAYALVLLSRPWRLQELVRRMVGLLVCGYGGLFLGAWVQRFSGVQAADTSLLRMGVAALSFQGAALILIGQFLREQRLAWVEAFGFSDRRRQALVVGVIAALVFLPIGWVLQQVSAIIITHLPFLHLQPQEQIPIQALRVSLSWGGRLAMGAFAVLLAPVAEELMFRGILYPVIKQLGYPRLAFWGTSLLFAAVHWNLVTFLPLLALAVVLTLLYEHTGNLLAPIMAHLLFNAMNFAMLLVLQHFHMI